MSNVDISALSRYATNFQRQLIVTLINGLDILNSITLYPGVKNYTKLPKLLVKDGFRPYNAATEFGTKKDLVYSDRELKTEAGKRELLIDPEEYRPTYLSEVMSAGSGANKKEIPFAQFTWDQVIKRVQSEINSKTAYFGFDKSDADAWDNGTAYSTGDYVTFDVDGRTEYFQAVDDTNAAESPATHPAKWENVTAAAVAKGLGTIIAEEITAANISPVSLGAITSGAEAVAAFKELYRAVPVAIRGTNPIIIHASYTDVEFYMDEVEDKISKYTTPDVSSMMSNGLIPILGTNKMGWIKPATWLGSSRRLIANPMNPSTRKDMNMFFGTDLLSDLNQIKTKENLWTLEAGIKAVLGFQIADLDAMRVGDQS